jgi:RNA polymerase sigma-70 factor (ECF subfamily)
MPDDSSQPSTLLDLARLGQFYKDFRPKLLGMVRRRLAPALASRIDPEDVLNEAFLQARQRWQSFKQGSMSAYPWLYRITLDCLLQAWRRETRERRDVRDDLPWPEQSSVQIGLGLVHPGTSPTGAAVREEMRQHMKQVLDLLREKDREILRMRHEDELTFAEAGEVLGVSENAATVRYIRALQRLKDLWQKLHPESEIG